MEKNKEIIEKCATRLLEKETLEEAELLTLTEGMYREQK